jgi:curved DNA-binding protein CbpA
MAPPNFDPFDALGIDCRSDYTIEEIRKALRQASLHTHPDKRNPESATFTQFPSQIQVNLAGHYLSQSTRNIAYAAGQ